MSIQSMIWADPNEEFAKQCGAIPRTIQTDITIDNSAQIAACRQKSDAATTASHTKTIVIGSVVAVGLMWMMFSR